MAVSLNLTVVDVGDLVDGGRDGPRGHARLQREAQLVAWTPPGPDVLRVVTAQGVVAPQVRLTWRKGKNRADLYWLVRTGLRAMFSC